MFESERMNPPPAPTAVELSVLVGRASPSRRAAKPLGDGFLPGSARTLHPTGSSLNSTAVGTRAPQSRTGFMAPIRVQPLEVVPFREPAFWEGYLGVRRQARASEARRRFLVLPIHRSGPIGMR